MDFGLRNFQAIKEIAVLGNLEISRNSQECLELKASAQPNTKTNLLKGKLRKMCWKFRNISCKTILSKSILRYFCNILYKIVEFNIHLKTGHQQISVTLFIIKSGKVLSFKFYNLSHQIYCQIYQIFGSSE